MNETTMLGGRYRLESPLGSGARGEIWRARDTALSRDVVVRFADAVEKDPQARQRFRTEATAAASLTHRNAVTIYDVITEDGRPFLVMELVEGIGLPLLIRRGPIAPEFVALIGRDAAAALGSAHQRRMVHRDVRPDNILLSVAGVAKLRGFGFADTLAAPSTAWQPPEGADADARGDVFSLGLVLHACLTGWRPPRTGVAPELIPDLADNVASDCPRALLEAVTRATDPDPGQRFADGDGLVATLGEMVTPAVRDRLAAVVEPLAEDAEAGEPTTSPTRSIGAPDGDAARTMAQPATEPTSGDAGPTPGDTGPGSGDTGRMPAAGSTPWWRERTGALVAGALSLVVALGLAVWAVGGPSGPLGGDGLGGDGDDGGRTTTGGQPVGITRAADFDPFSDGGSEHPEETSLAVDGDPSTAWSTERYNTPELGGLKPGVGLWVELDEPARPGAVELTLGPGAVDVELYVSEDPPSGTDQSAWGTRVATGSAVSGSTSLNAEQQAEGRFLLVWITRLAPHEGGYGAEVAELSVLASG